MHLGDARFLARQVVEHMVGVFALRLQSFTWLMATCMLAEDIRPRIFAFQQVYRGVPGAAVSRWVLRAAIFFFYFADWVELVWQDRWLCQNLVYRLLIDLLDLLFPIDKLLSLFCFEVLDDIPNQEADVDGDHQAYARQSIVFNRCLAFY